MRLIMTKEMAQLWKEIEPYLDTSHESGLRTDTPKEIRIKAQKFDELDRKQEEEAMMIELGFIPKISTHIIDRMKRG